MIGRARGLDRTLASFVLLSALACGRDQPEVGLAPESFPSVFEAVGTVTLQEDPSDPMVGLTFLTRRPDGGFAVADELGDKVRLFDAQGRLEATFGGPGDGPGELDAPTAVVELPDGRVFVTQRATPRLTVYPPGSDPIALTLPGRYGTWLHDVGDRLVAGIGSRDDRFAVISFQADSLASFGPLQPEVNQRPFWIYFARERAAAWSGGVATNTSFYPTIRLFDLAGEDIGTIDLSPTGWTPADDPPVDRASTAGDRDAVRDWSTSFTIVSGLAAVGDDHLVVQYGRFAPTDQDPYRVEASSLDVYTLDGDRVAVDLASPQPILGGGAELLLLGSEPPEPWTIERYRLRGGPDPDARQR